MRFCIKESRKRERERDLKVGASLVWISLDPGPSRFRQEVHDDFLVPFNDESIVILFDYDLNVMDKFPKFYNVVSVITNISCVMAKNHTLLIM